MSTLGIITITGLTIMGICSIGLIVIEIAHIVKSLKK
jgi:hypothetical protein